MIEEEGKYYYYNKKLGVTQWEPPTLESHGGYRPCVWRIQYDDASGRNYFQHRMNNEVVWNIPAGGSSSVDAGMEEEGVFSQTNPQLLSE